MLPNMFNPEMTTFTGGQNCGGYQGNERYHEVKEEFRTEENFWKDCEGSFFVPEKMLRIVENIPPITPGGLFIIAHTDDYYVTLDPSGRWPVLHQKGIFSRVACTGRANSLPASGQV